MAEFSYLVAKDQLNLNKKKINLKKLVGYLKNSKEFELNGDPSLIIDTFNQLMLKTNQVCFYVTTNGYIRYLKIDSIDFFLRIDKFKKNFFKEYVKKCLE